MRGQTVISRILKGCGPAVAKAFSNRCGLEVCLRKFYWVWLGWLWIASLPLQATPTPTPTAAASPQVVVASEVMPRLEATLLFLRGVEAGNDSELEVLERKGEGLENEVLGASRLLPSQVAANLTPSELEQLEKSWQGYRERLARIREQLQSESKRLEKTRDQSQEQAELWRGALEDQELLEVPPEILQQIQTANERLGQADKRLGEEQAALFVVSSRINALETRLEAGLNHLATARRERVSRLLQADEPPIWRSDFAALQPVRLAAQLHSSLEQQVLALFAYLRANVQGFLYHLLSLVGLYFGLNWAGRRVADWAEQEPALVHPAANLKRPLPMAILLSVLMARTFYPHPPILWRAALAAAALIPAILVLRRLLPRVLHATLYLLVILFCVDQLRTIVGSLPLLNRLIFAGELVAVLTCLVQTLRDSQMMASWQRRLVELGVLFFTLSLTALLFGFVGLGYTLGDAALRSLYLAVFLFSMTEILRILLLLLLRTRPLSYLKAVRERESAIRRRLGHWVQLLAVLIWIWNSLHFLGVRQTLLEALASPLAWNLRIGALVITLGGVLGMALSVWAPVQVSRVVRYLFDTDVYPRLDLTPGSSYTFNTVLHYLLLSAGVLLGVAALGIDMTKFTIVASALGVGIGFGLQNIVNNFISGLILLFERPVEVGHTIEVSDRTGRLTRVGLRSSVVRTVDGSDVIIPNGELLSKLVTNWTLSERRRLLKIPVGVAYGTSVEQVESLLLEVARAHPLVLHDPEPGVLFLNLGDSALEFELRAWTGEFDQWAKTRSQLLKGVYEALNAAEVGIPFPTRTLYVEPPSG
ncbi:hypothetical protein ABS71_14010 [bacterium SCN 62-11]|nr:MAG: hypothetical protein ABS71_14010 [bacterium SCN 62-11]